MVSAHTATLAAEAATIVRPLSLVLGASTSKEAVAELKHGADIVFSPGYST